MTEQQSSLKECLKLYSDEMVRPFSHIELKSITSNFKENVGSGAFGNVFKGQLPDGGAQVAVKVLINNTSAVTEKQFIAEVFTMGKTYHQNLIKLYGYCFEPDIKALVYEFMENGSLDKVLYENQLNLDWVKLYDIAIGIAKGLSYLHESCRQIIIHHDIKPANVLLDSKFCPKVTDFGLARVCNTDTSQVSQTTFRGTGNFAAPEVSLGHEKITSKCDVFSFGIMLFEILRKKKNHDGEDWFPGIFWRYFEKGQLNEILIECGIDENVKEKAKRLSKVALMCVQYKPQDRPLMSDVVKMLEGVIKFEPPHINPFPYYVSSSDQSSMSGGSPRTSSLPATFDESCTIGGSSETSSLPPNVSTSGGLAKTSSSLPATFAESFSPGESSKSGGSVETSSLPPNGLNSAASDHSQAMHLANPITVIRPQYCAPVPVNLIIARNVRAINNGCLAAFDVQGNLIFKVASSRSLFNFLGHPVLLDSNGYPLVTLQRTILFTAHDRWKVYRGDSSDDKDHLFSVKQSSVVHIRNQQEVFLASNTQEKVCDFKIRGSWYSRSCVVYLGNSSNIIAQMQKNHSAEGILQGKGTSMVTVYPNVSHAFIVALLVTLSVDGLPL